MSMAPFHALLQHLAHLPLYFGRLAAQMCVSSNGVPSE